VVRHQALAWTPCTTNPARLIRVSLNSTRFCVPASAGVVATTLELVAAADVDTEEEEELLVVVVVVEDLEVVVEVDVVVDVCEVVVEVVVEVVAEVVVCFVVVVSEPT